MEGKSSLRERLQRRANGQKPIEDNNTKVEVIELYDENGESIEMELVHTIIYNGNEYLVLTPFIEEIDPDIPQDVFIMQKEIKDDGEKIINPVENKSLVEKIFAKFKKEYSGNYELYDKSNMQLFEKQQEVEIILSQVHSKLNSSILNDVQKSKLAQAANKLNALCKNGDIVAIDAAITEVKETMNCKTSTNIEETGTKPPHLKSYWKYIFIGLFCVIVLFHVLHYKGIPTPISIDYTVKAKTAIDNAINAFDNGQFNNAFNFYNEAANYPTDRSTSIKQDAAKKFKEKAEQLIAVNHGKCSEKSKQLLQYANSLFYSSEIQMLIDKCNSISSKPGRFPQASERILSHSDLSGLSKYDLKIMRNEIFARHGYIFKTNEMKNYFHNQSWYSPRYSNVNSHLTRIENENIKLIKRYE